MNKQLLTQTIDQRIGDVNLINEPVVEAPLINGGVVEGSYLARKRIGRPAALEIYSIRDVCYAASFGYKPMPSDGYFYYKQRFTFGQKKFFQKTNYS